MNRRDLIAVALATPAMLLIPGCVAAPELSFEEAIRRLLGLAAQRALASLMRENGFYQDAVARISLPSQLGGEGASRVLSAILLSGPVRNRLWRQANRAAEKGAELAAPFIADAIRTMPVGEALAVVRGGPSEATDLLRGRIGGSLVSTMLPGIDRGLRLFDSGAVTEVLRIASGIDFAELRDDVAAKAADGVFKAIAREEAAIRADPQSTNDPLLIGVFGLARTRL